MSDLKKTFQDMDKTEVGEYRHGRGHFPTEDDGGRANVEVLQALCPNPGATALESVVWAADQIEALEIFRRDAKVENAELHSQIESLTSENTRLRARLRREVDLVSRCDDCGAELYESAGYFECDDMCQKCFDQWNGMPFEEIAAAIEKSQPQPPSHKGED